MCHCWVIAGWVLNLRNVLNIPNVTEAEMTPPVTDSVPEISAAIHNSCKTMKKRKYSVFVVFLDCPTSEIWVSWDMKNYQYSGVVCLQSKCYELQGVLYCTWTVCELRRQALQLGVPMAVLAVKMVLERLMEITGTEDEKEEEDRRRGLLTCSQRVSVWLYVLTHCFVAEPSCKDKNKPPDNSKPMANCEEFVEVPSKLLGASSASGALSVSVQVPLKPWTRLPISLLLLFI